MEYFAFVPPCVAWIIAKPVDFCQCFFLVLHIISQYSPPKQGDLTTLSRALPQGEERSPLLQTSVPYCLLYHTVLPVGAHSPLLTSHPPPPTPPIRHTPMPENNLHAHGNTSMLLLSAWILYSRGANCIFYCFVAQWFFTRMLIWHFNKLCEWLHCCGRIAPIRLTADPLSAPFSL